MRVGGGVAMVTWRVSLPFDGTEVLFDSHARSVAQVGQVARAALHLRGEGETG